MEPLGSLVCSHQPTTCPCPELDQFNACPPTLFCWRLILMFSLCLFLGLPSSCLPSFPAKTMYAPLLFSICTTYPASLILLYLIAQIIFGEDSKSWSSSLWSFLQFTVTSSFIAEISIHIIKLVNKQFIFFQILIFFVHGSLSLFFCNCKYVQVIVISCA